MTEATQQESEDWKHKYLELLRELEANEGRLDEAEELLRLAINRFGMAVADSYPDLQGSVESLRTTARQEGISLEDLREGIHSVSRAILDAEAHAPGDKEAATAPPEVPPEATVSDLGHAAGLLTRMLENVSLTEALEPERSDLLAALGGSLAEDELAVLVDRSARLVNRMRRQLQQEKTELGGFLEQLTGALTEIDQHLGKDDESREASRQEQEELHETVSGGVSELRAQVEDQQDIAHLKSVVSERLDNIRERMEQFRESERTRRAESEARNRELKHRLGQLEGETEELREALRRNRLRMLEDPLTGIYNRLAFEERLHQEWVRRERHGGVMSLAILDIDHFKRINDDFGHKAGDKALRIVAQRIASLIRESDFLGRYGGEEFVLLLPETGLEDARRVADKLRAAVAETSFRYRDNPLEITVSCGVGEAGEGESEESLFRRTDEALYQAKANGRNRTEVAEPD